MRKWKHCGPSTHQARGNPGTDSPCATSGWNESKLRRVDHLGMLRLRWVAQFLGHCLAARRSARRMCRGQPPPPKLLAGPHNNRMGVSQAAESLGSLRQKYTELQAKFQLEIEKVDAALRPESLVFEPSAIRPKKTDITVERVVLAWMPYHVGVGGQIEAAY